MSYHRTRMSILVIWLLAIISFINQSTNADLRTIELTGGVDTGSVSILHDLSIAYGINEPELSMDLNHMTAPETIAALSKGSIDFGVAIQGFDQTVNKALYLMPLFITAFAPVYSINTISSDTTLVFSRQTLFGIMIGTIKSWSDPAIKADNPSIALPNLPIIVVLENVKAAKNYIIKNALNQFNSTLFSQTSLTLTNVMDFNLSNYAAYRLVEMKENTLATSVLATNGAFGIAYYPVARKLGVSIGNMINKAGATVSVSYQSLTYAAIELGTVQAFTHTTAQVLTDASAALAWPLTLYANLIIDSESSPSTCKARQVLVEFFLYVYQSNVALSFMLSYGVSGVPQLLLDNSGAVNILSTTIQCRGAPALPTQAVAQRTLGVSRDLSFFGTLAAAVFTDQNVEWVSQSVYDNVLVTRMVNAEVDLAIINQDAVNPDIWQQFVDSGDFLILPMGASADSWFFNPQLTNTLSLQSSEALILDDSLIASLFAGCFQNWNDPDILELNPWISDLTNNASHPFFKLMGCGSLNDPNSAPRGFAMANYVRQWAFDPAHASKRGAQCAKRFFSDPTATSSWYSCTSNYTQLVFFGADESILPSIVLGIQSSATVGPVDNNVAKLFPQISRSMNGIDTIIQPNQDGILACASDTFDSSTLSFSPHKSSNSSCWPLLQQYSLVARRQYYSSALVTNSSLCGRGLDALQFMYWILASEYSNTLTQALNMGTYFQLPGIAARYSDELNSVLCDLDTLYITLPVIWSLNPGLEFVALAAAVLGIVFTISLMVFIVKYREHVAIRASSPVFTLLSLFGILLLFAGVIAFVLPVTVESCAAFAWLANLGVQVAFAPLIFKAFRIYSIFGRRKLSVTKISNRKLMSWVSVSVGIEVLLLSIWQGTSPEQPYTSTETSGSSGQVSVFTQCSAEGAGSALLGIVIAFKAILLVFGCLLAFGTRKVTSKFNESSQIAISIYNITFISLVIGAILAMIDVNGDAEVGMVTFVALWVGFSTAALMVVPKILLVMRPEDTEDGSEPSSQMSNGGFSFLSIEQFSTVALISTYVAALKKHLEEAETKLQKMKRKQNPEGSHKRTNSKLLPAVESIVSARGPSSVSLSVSTSVLRARPQAPSHIISAALASPSSTVELMLPPMNRSKRLSTKPEGLEMEEKELDAN